MSEQGLRVAAVLNRDSGSLISADIDALDDALKTEFEKAGHSISVHCVSGPELTDAITKAANDDDKDVILVGGGDGSISTAAGIAWKTGKTLAVLPGGTMNLFARTLGLPINPMQAIKPLAQGKVRKVDIATANGVPFVHQYSLGIHSQTVKARQSYSYRSRVGKMMASTRAFFDSLRKMPLCRIRIVIDGKEEVRKVGALSVTNNLFGSFAPPYTTQPDGGELGVYMSGRLSGGEALELAADTLFGQMQNSRHLTIETGRKVELTILKAARASHFVLDGELNELDRNVVFELHPKELTVLA